MEGGPTVGNHAHYAVSMTRLLRILPTALLTLLLVLSIAACSRTGGDNAPIKPTTDELRIVVISPALAAILVDLGLESNIVGRHGWDQVLDPALPICGDQSGLDYEALLRAQPTHVFTEWGSRELPAKLTNLAASEGWLVRDFRLLTLTDIDTTATELETLFPQASPSEGVMSFHALVTEPPPELVWGGRVLLLMSTSPITALGPGSAHHELLMRAGGVPAIEEGSPYMPLHAEDVLRLAPDAIVLIQPGSMSGSDTIGMEHDLGPILDLDIPAIKHERFAWVSEPLGLLPSTRLEKVAVWIGRTLEEWAQE